MGVCQYYLAQSLDGYFAESDGGIDWLTQYQGEARLDDETNLEQGPMDGRPTFPGRLKQQLRLTRARTYGNGMVELRYDFVHGS